MKIRTKLFKENYYNYDGITPSGYNVNSINNPYWNSSLEKIEVLYKGLVTDYSEGKTHIDDIRKEYENLLKFGEITKSEFNQVEEVLKGWDYAVNHGFSKPEGD